jgi:hypothetical protein
MKITAKVLTIVATAILLLSALGLLVCIVFQEPLIQLLFGYSRQVFAVYSTDSIFTLVARIPAADIVYLTVLLLTGVVLCLTVCAKRVGWWTEIIALAALMVNPAITWLIRQIQWRFIVDGMAFYYSYLTNLVSYATTFVGFAMMLLLVACGMSIAYKHLTRKQEKALSASSGEQIFPDAVQNP